MTQAAGGGVFSGSRLAMATMAVVVAALSGCLTPDPDEAALAAAAPKSAAQVKLADNAQNTGTFPNLNIPPQTAAPQFSSLDRRDKFRELAAKKKGQAASAAGKQVADPAVIKKLGETHVKDTLAAIEAE